MKTARDDELDRRFGDGVERNDEYYDAMIKELGGKPKRAPNSQLADIKLLLFCLIFIIAIAIIAH
jgi:hypothetical protein